jgi:sugar O-acyltransferase (sialic acid O-acetyltransferase NeuD family)
VDRKHIPPSPWNGLPVVDFAQVAEVYPPANHDMFIALGYQDLNRLRARKCEEARVLGYALPSYVHPQSGLPQDCEYGDNCFVMNHVLVHPKVRFGNNVFIWSGAMVGHHSVIGDNSWLTSCCNVSGAVTLGKNCFLAVNSTVAHSVRVGNNCFIGANTLINKCTKDGEVYIAESTKPFRLNSSQFLRISKLSDL